MKNTIQYILIAGLVTAFACSDFLSEQPKSTISEDQYYKTPTDALNAVNATYFFYNAGGANGSNQSAYNSLLQVGMEFATDEQYPGPGATNPDVRSFSVHNHSSTNRTFYELWQQHYSGIKKANVAIEKIPLIDFGSNTGLQERYVGEAKFNRAFIYFNLVRLWGDIPLITENQNFVKAQDYYIAKSAAIEIYAQIEKDLNEAAAVLPISYSGGDIGRATAGAAKALLAKVYLTKASFPLKISSNYQDAVNKAEEVLSASDGGTGVYNYNLRSEYSHVFLPAFKNNEEHIFSAQFLSNFQSQGRNDFPRTLPRFPSSFGVVGTYADQVNFYTKGADKSFSVYKLYKAKDKRRKVTFATKFVNPKNGAKFGTPLANPAYPGDSIPYLNKTYDPSAFVSVPSEAATNVTLLRYAEILLIHAEAENEANGPTDKAYKSLNRVRKRAGLEDLTPGLSQSQFRDSLYLDRELELVYEYQRWFDLIRQRDAAGNPSFVQKLHDAGKTNAVDRNRWYPIPQIELDNNPLLEQNELWK
ncbi:MAG TPA: RagB/SusD family nutrient uptake outer membrane protein [Chryseolinea sp.]|nr:RagB/SusD family nutrient uptake outer membrane protein [Chryseolinea sp.]